MFPSRRTPGVDADAHITSYQGKLNEGEKCRGKLGLNVVQRIVRVVNE